MKQPAVQRHRLGFTLIEMAVSMLAGSVLILVTGAFLADYQRAFNDTYDYAYSSAQEADMAARTVFYQTVRQAASTGAASVASDGSWLEVQYYSQPESSSLDRSARFYLSEQDLLLKRTDLDTGQPLSVQTVCGTVSSVRFALTGNSARMFLELDDGSSTRVVNASAAGSGDITDDVTITQSSQYGRINLGNPETLVIDGTVELYVTGDVVLGNGARIEIREGASLVLYVDGAIEGKYGSEFNNLTADPRAFRIMGTDSCEQVELKNSGDMYAIIYTSEADVSLYNSATMWGSVTSKTAELKGNALFHYDTTLASYDDPLLSELQLARWREY